MPDERPTLLDLFSGIGGFSLAFEAEGFQTVAFVEADKHRQNDLAHHWPGIPIVPDVRDIDAIGRALADGQGVNGRLSERRQRGNVPESQRGSEAACGDVANSRGSQADKEPRGAIQDGGRRPDCIGRCNLPSLDALTAGVPCQPASAAGKRKGSADDRWLWPATLRVVERFRPRVCVFENPLGIASLAQSAAIPGVDLERLREVPGRTLCEILTGLDLLGYDIARDRDGMPWIPVVPAAGVGAFHGRDRLWIVAWRRDVENPVLPEGSRFGREDNLPSWEDARIEQGADGLWRAVKPGLHLLANGVPRRVAKLRGFGNAIVPQVAQVFARAIYHHLKPRER